MQHKGAKWGFIQNRNNKNGEAPIARNVRQNAYKNTEDTFGVERFQAAPLYLLNDLSMPERYGEDGSWVRILSETDTAELVLAKIIHLNEKWMIPTKYIKPIPDSIAFFKKVIFVDKRNQNTVTLEKEDAIWKVRSMNHVTTGQCRPPYQYETPAGIFVVQEKKAKMYFLEDGTNDIAGFSPHASRFSNGAYIHGIPVNYPRETTIDLGTVPRSHKCVRNVTSHAEFIYGWAQNNQTLVVVF